MQILTKINITTLISVKIALEQKALINDKKIIFNDKALIYQET